MDPALPAHFHVVEVWRLESGAPDAGRARDAEFEVGGAIGLIDRQGGTVSDIGVETYELSVCCVVGDDCCRQWPVESCSEAGHRQYESDHNRPECSEGETPARFANDLKKQAVCARKEGGAGASARAC